MANVTTSSQIDPPVYVHFKRNNKIEKVKVFECIRTMGAVFNSIQFDDGEIMSVPNQDLIFGK